MGETRVMLHRKKLIKEMPQVGRQQARRRPLAGSGLRGPLMDTRKQGE